MATKSFMGFRLEPAVFIPSAIIIISLVVIFTLMPDVSGAVLTSTRDWIVANLGWFYILSVTGFLIFVVWLGLSPYGAIKLGQDDEKPEFSTLGWFAMLFSAGMGIGLLYNGVGEPLTHFTGPPLAEPRSQAAADEAMKFTFYHWGFHPWAIYSVVGLAIGYFGYRRGMPISLRSAFYPLFGERIYGPIGHIIDTFAVVGTMFGVAASLALGALQISAGIERVFGIPTGPLLQVTVIAVVTLTATISVVSGLSRGIQRLSQVNLLLSGAFLLFIFVAGSTVFLLDSFVQNIGYYLEILARTAFWTDPQKEAQDWLASWTLAYWGWWLAWAPFVGIFVARVSRGRTIRQFVFAVLIVPTVVSFFWFSVAGESAIRLVQDGAESIATTLAGENGLDVVMYEYLTYFPYSSVTSIMVMIAVFIFFVTSSDSGSLVIDMLTAGGETDPPRRQRVFWAVTEGFVASALLLAGGLAATRSAVAAVGLPVAVLLIGMCWGLYRALREERHGIFADRMEDAEDYREKYGEGAPDRDPETIA